MSDSCCQEHPKPEMTQPTIQEQTLLEDLRGNLSYPSTRIDELIYGQKFLALRTEHLTGLSSTLGAQPTPTDTALLRRIPGMSLTQASEFLYSESPFMISVGLAALNAGTTLPSSDIETGIGAAEIIAEKGAGQDVVIVGDFPFIDALRPVVRNLHVLELRDTVNKTPSDQWDTILESCQVAAITSTSLLTRYMAFFLEHTHKAYTILLGPSTPLSSVFYRWGVSALAGSRVRNPKEVCQGIRQDMSFRQLKPLGIDFVLGRHDELFYQMPGILV